MVKLEYQSFFKLFSALGMPIFMIKSVQVDDYINRLDENQKKLVTKLRAIIFKTFPKMKEEFKWSLPYYMPVCYIGAFKDHVNLGILFGGLIKDPKLKNMMEGTGASMRHVKIYKLGDINQARISKILKEAYKAYAQGQSDKEEARRIKLAS